MLSFLLQDSLTFTIPIWHAVSYNKLSLDLRDHLNLLLIFAYFDKNDLEKGPSNWGHNYFYERSSYDLNWIWPEKTIFLRGALGLRSII